MFLRCERMYWKHIYNSDNAQNYHLPLTLGFNDLKNTFCSTAHPYIGKICGSTIDDIC